MADQRDIHDHYDTLGALHALRMESVHEYPDYTCALFDGQKKPYKEAQEDKHAWIFDGLGLGQDLHDKKVLDIGCGWGPIGNAARKRGGGFKGLTLSSHQVEYCHRHGLDVDLRDYKTLGQGEFGCFDGIVSLGAFEHFCSIKEMLAGKQDEVYKKFFDICASHLPVGGRLYLQTMTWGDNPPQYRRLSLEAPKNSPRAILARMERLYPGSWLPNGLQQLIDCASGQFEFISSKNGRLDYIETLKGWNAATPNLWSLRNLPHTLRHAAPMALKYITNRDARIQMESVRRGDQRQCFERSIMSHERAFFVKKSLH